MKRSYSLLDCVSIAKKLRRAEKFFYFEMLLPEIKFIIFELFLKSKLLQCQTYDDFIRLKILINTINNTSSELFKTIITRNLNRLNNLNVNNEQAYKIFVYAVLADSKILEFIKKTKFIFDEDEIFSINRLWSNVPWLEDFILRQKSPNKKKLSQLLKYYKHLSKVNGKLIDFVDKNNIEGVKKALFDGANPNLMSINRHCILCNACNSDDPRCTTIIKDLIDAGANVNLKCDYFGCAPIFTAVKDGSVEIVKILLEAGVDSSIIDAEGYLPISWANQEEKVKLLDPYYYLKLSLFESWGPIFLICCHLLDSIK